MTERQLITRSMVTGVDAARRDSESCRDSKKLECNVAENETVGNK
jgi:hypothetical protein